MNQAKEYAFLKTTYENLPIGVMQFKKTGKTLSLLHINDFGRRILDFQKTSGIQFDFHAFMDRLPGNAYEEFLTALDRLKNPGEHFPFIRPIYVGEKKSWLSGTASLISLDGPSQKYICVFSDDTINMEKRIHADDHREQEIKILNEMCTLIVDRSFETLGLVDTKTGRYRIYAAQENDWFSKKEPEGSFDELTRLAAAQLAYDDESKRLLSDGTVSRLIDRLDQSPDPCYTITYRVRTREAYRWKRAKYSYLKDDKTKIIFYAQDIQNEKIEEERLSKLASKERQIHQEKMAFFANMSHEIRTPMNAILNLSELLLRKELPPDIEQDISTIYEIGGGLLGIINSLLSFSKLDAGNIQLTTGSYSLSALVSDVCSMISARLSQKNLYFFTNLDPSSPRQLIGDEMHIREIMVNLLSNAVKFTVSGKIELRVRVQRLSDTKAQLVFSVSDTGSGIKEEDQKHLFRQFSRIDTKKNQTVTGTGLGLSISKKLSELMGGTISVESEYQKGSTFTVSIPQEIHLAGDMIPISDKMRQAEIFLYLPDQDKDLASYILRGMRKLCIHPSFISSLSSVNIGDQKNSYLILKQSDFPACREQVDALFSPDQVLLLMKNSETTEPKYYHYYQVYPYNLMLQTANILNGHAVHPSAKKVKVYEDTAFPSAKILIVDDNAVNISVAKRLMEPYEMEIDLASNGYETLDMAAKKTYDLIFLDHMMPGMDGVETVHKLRAMEDLKKNLPVIALTANVFSDAKAYFTKEGFTDFLAKPINVKELHNILLHYLQEKAVLKAKEPKAAVHVSEELRACFAPLKHFDVDASLDYFDHSADFYMEMLKTFQQGLSERRRELDDIFENRDLHLFTIHVHAIKSAAKSVGASEFSDFSKKMEEFGHQNDWKSITGHYEEFLNYIDLILGELNEWMEKLPSMAEKKESLSCYPEPLVKNLCIAVNEMDYPHVLEIIKELDHYSYPPEHHKLLQRLKTACDDFEYEELNRCSVMMYNSL